MKPTPKTIQIYLPGGDPRGIRVAEITTRIVQVIEVPRSLLDDFLRMHESKQVAVYFLVGATEQDALPSVYVGQSSDLPYRLKEHNKKKDFWERALVLISRTHSLTQTHALFLESYAIEAAKVAGRYTSRNGNAGSRPHTPAPLEAECLEIFETGQTLLATLGHPIFESVADPVGGTAGNATYFCTASGIDAQGLYTPEGFVVLAGSRGRRANVPSIEGKSDGRFRRRLVEQGVMREEGEHVFFDKDHLFKTPSTAAVALLGRTSNGWREWKNAEGDTLETVERAPAVEEDA